MDIESSRTAVQIAGLNLFPGDTSRTGSDDKLKSILQKDIDTTQQHIKELKSLME